MEGWLATIRDTFAKGSASLRPTHRSATAGVSRRMLASKAGFRDATCAPAAGCTTLSPSELHKIFAGQLERMQRLQHAGDSRNLCNDLVFRSPACLMGMDSFLTSGERRLLQAMRTQVGQHQRQLPEPPGQHVQIQTQLLSSKHLHQARLQSRGQRISLLYVDGTPRSAPRESRGMRS